MTRIPHLFWSFLASCLLAAPVMAQKDTKKVRELEGWGTTTNPDGDCTFKLDPKNKKLTIHVPGSKPHLLSAEAR